MRFSLDLAVSDSTKLNLNLKRVTLPAHGLQCRNPDVQKPPAVIAWVVQNRPFVDKSDYDFVVEIEDRTHIVQLPDYCYSPCKNISIKFSMYRDTAINSRG